MLDQQRDVVAALAQRRQRDLRDVQAEEEIPPELPLLDHAREIAVRGGHDADVDLARALAADPPQLALLQDAQQLALHAGRHLADLVEEQRAAVGDLEQAARVALGAGEGAAHVAEQRRFEQRLGDGGAVLADERASRRGPFEWMARATSSLPVPLSPWITTGSVVSVMRSSSRNRSSMRGVRPMMLR